MNSHSSPLLITLGEPGGVGPDCVLRAWQADADAFDQVVVVTCYRWLAERAQMLGLSVPLHELSSLGDAGTYSGLRVYDPLSDDVVRGPVTVGQTSEHTAQAVIAYIEWAARACLQHSAVGMVTAPIEKAVLRRAGFDFPGHTEFLSHIAGEGPGDIVMMLASKELRVALLTTHIALRDVPAALSVEQTLRCIEITHRDLQQRFGIEQPRLGMCGLNPHAGEQGHFGDEEIQILQPAVDLARAAGVLITDPLPADTLFSAAQRQHFDAIVCCYHDQALIPLKALSFGDAVNVTLGLPFIRTSVDHGTALDRAGSDKVSYTSLMEAIRLAKDMGSKHGRTYAQVSDTASTGGRS